MLLKILLLLLERDDIRTELEYSKTICLPTKCLNELQIKQPPSKSERMCDKGGKMDGRESEK